MKPSFEADKFCNPKGSLKAKKLGYFKAFAGFRVALPSPYEQMAKKDVLHVIKS